MMKVCNLGCKLFEEVKVKLVDFGLFLRNENW